MSDYVRNLRQLAEILLDAIKGANSKECLYGYFDHLVTDESYHLNYLLESVDMEPMEVANPDNMEDE